MDKDKVRWRPCCIVQRVCLSGDASIRVRLQAVRDDEDTKMLDDPEVGLLTYNQCVAYVSQRVRRRAHCWWRHARAAVAPPLVTAARIVV